nr:amidohydrolase family protein [Jiella pelagia]
MPSCDIEIRDGIIANILPAGSLPPSEDGVERIDARRGIAQPGFVNTHNHSPLTIVRGMVEDRGFAPAYTPGVPQGHWLSEDDTLALARLGILELLSAGSTTIVDYYRMPQALARAAEEIGVRAQIGGRVMDADTAALADGRFVHDPALGDQTLGAAVDLVETWDGRGNGRISTILAPHAPDTCSRGMLERFAESRRLHGQTGSHPSGAIHHGGGADPAQRRHEPCRIPRRHRPLEPEPRRCTLHLSVRSGRATGRPRGHRRGPCADRKCRLRCGGTGGGAAGCGRPHHLVHRHQVGGHVRGDALRPFGRTDPRGGCDGQRLAGSRCA